MTFSDSRIKSWTSLMKRRHRCDVFLLKLLFSLSLNSERHGLLKGRTYKLFRDSIEGSRKGRDAERGRRTTGHITQSFDSPLILERTSTNTLHLAHIRALKNLESEKGGIIGHCVPWCDKNRILSDTLHTSIPPIETWRDVWKMKPGRSRTERFCLDQSIKQHMHTQNSPLFFQNCCCILHIGFQKSVWCISGSSVRHIW